MIFSRSWSMPSADTFDCPPIERFVRKYLSLAKISVDPFARNKRWATYTNDLNPNMLAEYHMDAEAFLMMPAEQQVKADLILFDPRDAIIPICMSDAVILSFGWNSVGMGKANGFEQIEILLCCHGGAHNDTICLAERRLPVLQKQLL